METEGCQTSIPGLFELIGCPAYDKRGSFLNLFRSTDNGFEEAWACRMVMQINLSRTDKIGTVRGLHFQRSPYEECKIVRCIRGRVWDVIVDLRPSSPTYRLWHAAELSESSANAFVIPEGCAHGYQSLEANSELLYIHSNVWMPEAETGLRFDDPALGIRWPYMPHGLSKRDMELPFLESLNE